MVCRTTKHRKNFWPLGPFDFSVPYSGTAFHLKAPYRNKLSPSTLPPKNIDMSDLPVATRFNHHFQATGPNCVHKKMVFTKMTQSPLTLLSPPFKLTTKWYAVLILVMTLAVVLPKTFRRNRLARILTEAPVRDIQYPGSKDNSLDNLEKTHARGSIYRRT